MEDCVTFCQESVGLMPECDQKCIVEQAISKEAYCYIVGESLLDFGDKEWEDPSLGVRFHCRQAMSKKNKQNEIMILRKMQEKLSSTRPELWRRTYHCVNITVSFSTLLIFKLNTLLAAENRDLKCQGFNNHIFLEGRSPCRWPSKSARSPQPPNHVHRGWAGQH